MFIQVVQGTVSDVDALRAAVQRWRDDVAPGATGWLGTTAGVTADSRAIAVVRFASEDDARRNSDRPEQGQWWAAVSGLFGDDVEFHDCSEVITFLGGGSDEAGFVQVMQGRVTDEAKLRAMMAQADERIGQARPDVLGGTVALHPDGGFTQVVYFTSEAEARAGERAEQTPEAEAQNAEMMSVFGGPPTFFDLTQPWLSSPR
jgi:hypothetical protein